MHNLILHLHIFPVPYRPFIRARALLRYPIPVPMVSIVIQVRPSVNYAILAAEAALVLTAHAQVFKFVSCRLSRFPYTIKGFIKNQMIIFKIQEIGFYLIVNVRGLFRGGSMGTP